MSRRGCLLQGNIQPNHRVDYSFNLAAAAISAPPSLSISGRLYPSGPSRLHHGCLDGRTLTIQTADTSGNSGHNHVARTARRDGSDSDRRMLIPKADLKTFSFPHNCDLPTMAPDVFFSKNISDSLSCHSTHPCPRVPRFTLPSAFSPHFHP